MKITTEVLEGHLNCKFKGHLKLAGEVGTRSDYEAMTTAARAKSRMQALAKLVGGICKSCVWRFLRRRASP